MAVLYRKYRPQTFAEVVGQQHIVRTLKNQAKAGKPAHAYLFTGGRGVGKTSIARIMAKAVNCQKAKVGEPCGTCEVCTQIADGSFMDLVEIDAASNTGVDNIRDLIEHIKFSPTAGKYKVFIIDEVHMLSKGAFNALLKTLEEPPAHAMFILATTEINKVPATIISRTQRFDFKSLSIQDLAGHLSQVAAQEDLQFDPEIFTLIAQRAEGGMRDALSLLGKVQTLGNTATLEECRQLLGVTDVALSEDLLRKIVIGAAATVPEFFENLGQQGLDAAVFNRDFLEYLRKVLVCKVTAGKQLPGLGESHDQKVLELSRELTVNEIVFVIRLFLRSFKEIPGAPEPEIPLLLAAVEACLKRSAPEVPVQRAVVPSSGQKAAAPVFTVTQTPAQTTQPPSSIVAESAGAIDQSTTAKESSAAYSSQYDSTVTVEELHASWPAVIDRLKQHNGPLANLLKNSPLQDIRDGKAVLGVKYLFHKQNLENQKNLKLICDTIAEVSGKRVGLTTEIVKKEESVPVDHAGALDSAIKLFGGELIE